MKVAFFLPDLAGGGAERAVLLLAQHWPPSAPPPAVVLRARGGTYLDEAVFDRVEIHDLGLPRVSLRSSLETPRRLARWARHQNVDAVVAVLAVQSVALARLVGLRSPVFWSVQNPVGADGLPATAGSRERARQLAIRSMISQSARLLTGVMVPAAGLGDSLPGAAARLPRLVIPNPLDPAVFEAAAEPAPRVPGKVVAVGRLAPQKRFDVLIDAVARLGDSVTCTIYGEGAERPVLEQQIADRGVSGRFSLPGFCDDLSAIYGDADAFALTSDFEGFGNVLVEALAHSLPVVSTDAPYGPPEILDGGRYGVLVPRGDPGAVADAIAEVLETDRGDALRATARSRAVQYLAPRLAQTMAHWLDARLGGVDRAQ